MARTVKFRLSYKDGDDDWVTLGDCSFLTQGQQRVYQTTVTSTTKVLWDAAASGAMASFTALLIHADAACEIELTCNEGDANEEIAVHSIKAGGFYVLTADDSRYNHSADDGFAGTANVIDKVRVKESAGATCTVTMRAWEA